MLKEADHRLRFACREDQVQASLVYPNTIMIQEVLEDPGLLGRMAPRDLAALGQGGRKKSS